MIGFNGGLIGTPNTTTAAQSVPGMWTSREQLEAVRNMRWPGNLLDPFYPNVTLLLHGDGTNGSTTIINSSPFPSNTKTITCFGNASISTTEKKFGTGSLYFDGTGDYINIGDGSSADDDFGSGDFTMEAWVYKVSGAGAAILAKRQATSPSGWYFADNGFGGVVGGWTDPILSASIATGTWNHVAVTRSGNTFRLFHNGSVVSTNTSLSGALQNQSGQIMRVGMGGGTTESPANAYFDEIRITKGFARYTANFTPPIAAFPES